jgi:hypothetical protein
MKSALSHMLLLFAVKLAAGANSRLFTSSRPHVTFCRKTGKFRLTADQGYEDLTPALSRLMC